MFNDVVLVGHISTESELKYTQSGLAILSFGVETTESYVNNGERVTKSEFHRCVAFGTRAEGVTLRKGELVYVNGKLRTRKYQDREGNERYITEISVNRIVDLSKPQEGEAPQQASAPARQQYQQRKPAPQRKEEPGWDTPPADIDQCPF